PAADQGYGRTAGCDRAAEHRRRCRAETWGAAGAYFVRWSAGTGEDDVCYLPAAGVERAADHGERASPQGTEGLAAVLDEHGRAGHFLYRRNPSAAEGGRGVSLHGDGGFSARHRAGR